MGSLEIEIQGMVSELANSLWTAIREHSDKLGELRRGVWETEKIVSLLKASSREGSATDVSTTGEALELAKEFWRDRSKYIWQIVKDFSLSGALENDLRVASMLISIARKGRVETNLVTLIPADDIKLRQYFVYPHLQAELSSRFLEEVKYAMVRVSDVIRPWEPAPRRESISEESLRTKRYMYEPDLELRTDRRVGGREVDSVVGIRSCVYIPSPGGSGIVHIFSPFPYWWGADQEETTKLFRNVCDPVFRKFPLLEWLSGCLCGMTEERNEWVDFTSPFLGEFVYGMRETLAKYRSSKSKQVQKMREDILNRMRDAYGSHVSRIYLRDDAGKEKLDLLKLFSEIQREFRGLEVDFPDPRALERAGWIVEGNKEILSAAIYFGLQNVIARNIYKVTVKLQKRGEWIIVEITNEEAIPFRIYQAIKEGRFGPRFSDTGGKGMGIYFMRRAVTHPSVGGFLDLISDPQANTTTLQMFLKACEE